MAADFGGAYAAAAVVAFLFSCTGPVAIILAIGAQGGLAESDIASWIFSAFCLNTLISIAFTLLYRQPLIFLWSIPGAVLVGALPSDKRIGIFAAVQHHDVDLEPLPDQELARAGGGALSGGVGIVADYHL